MGQLITLNHHFIYRENKESPKPQLCKEKMSANTRGGGSINQVGVFFILILLSFFLSLDKPKTFKTMNKTINPSEKLVDYNHFQSKIFIQVEQ